MTADEQRDQLVQEMLPVATSLVESVHDHDLPETWATLIELRKAGDWDRAFAVIVALAAMVDPAAGLSDLLGWTRSKEKWCRGCDRWRPVSAFGVDRSTKDGRRSRCKRCRADRPDVVQLRPARRAAA